MGKEQRFLVVKNKDSKDIKYFEYDKISGYNIKPNPNLNNESLIWTYGNEEKIDELSSGVSVNPNDGFVFDSEFIE